MTLYLMSTTLSLFLSTYRTVKVFGVLALLSFAAAYSFYTIWFISVWCFFAALLSVLVYRHFVLRKAERNEPRHMLGTTVFDRSTENSSSDRHS
jgi:1,4-dihydroxy-2-naphthoate octaprenyltransferase